MSGIESLARKALRDGLERYRDRLEQTFSELPWQEVEEVAALLLGAWRERRHIYILGNGGSAATASHLASDLAKSTILPGQARFRVTALTDNLPLLTAWANDTSYQEVFAQQLANLLEPGDVVIAISASGTSPNVLAAVELAVERGAHTIGFTGSGGGKLSQMVTLAVVVPSSDYGPVEDAHLALGHAITYALLASLKEVTVGEAGG